MGFRGRNPNGFLRRGPRPKVPSEERAKNNWVGTKSFWRKAAWLPSCNKKWRFRRSVHVEQSDVCWLRCAAASCCPSCTSAPGFASLIFCHQNWTEMNQDQTTQQHSQAHPFVCAGQIIFGTLHVLYANRVFPLRSKIASVQIVRLLHEILRSLLLTNLTRLALQIIVVLIVCSPLYSMSLESMKANVDVDELSQAEPHAPCRGPGHPYFGWETARKL